MVAFVEMVTEIMRECASVVHALNEVALEFRAACQICWIIKHNVTVEPNNDLEKRVSHVQKSICFSPVYLAVNRFG